MHRQALLAKSSRQNLAIILHQIRKYARTFDSLGTSVLLALNTYFRLLPGDIDKSSLNPPPSSPPEPPCFYAGPELGGHHSTIQFVRTPQWHHKWPFQGLPMQGIRRPKMSLSGASNARNQETRNVPFRGLQCKELRDRKCPFQGPPMQGMLTPITLGVRFFSFY